MIDYFTFSTKDANQYGVDGAILLHHIRYWVAKNEANDKNYHDGSYWTYNSTNAFSKLFPFWTARKVGRLLQKLEDDGAILSGNFNEKKYDRTKWFTLVNAITESGDFHLTNMVNAYTKNVEPIPDNNHITTQITNQEVIVPFDSDLFRESWELWKRYKREQFKFTYKSIISEQATLKDLAEISNHDEQNAIKLIHRAIAKGWKGIHAAKDQGKDNKFDSDVYRTYLNTI
jgi:hypothetical protein